jgi:hypothetical protein
MIKTGLLKKMYKSIRLKYGKVFEVVNALANRFLNITTRIIENRLNNVISKNILKNAGDFPFIVLNVLLSL